MNIEPKCDGRPLTRMFPKNHPQDSSMRPVVAEALRMARKTMPIDGYQYSARHRNNKVYEIAGEVTLKILRRHARKFGIEE